jgi:predicted nucleic acid-binding protein
MNPPTFQNNFFETSVLIRASNYFEPNSEKAYSYFKQGNFVICHIVLGEVAALYKRRIQIYNDILLCPRNSDESIEELLEGILNKNRVNSSNDRQILNQAFELILSNLAIDKTSILTKTQWDAFELETNKVFNRMKNRLLDINNSFTDFSFHAKHVIPKNMNNSMHPLLLRDLKKEISTEEKHTNDLTILTNATINAYKNSIYHIFVSNDNIHLNNRKKIYSTIDNLFPIQLELERKLNIQSLNEFRG